ncbi:DUF397 domain-containing protein [Streptomyces sp. NRRL S-350]|uniref:DUF397 domain-containing protein n=1 Tax=Streptomyces sp. NRRL S-350 TaxID=1463902 RepID=UPI000561C057|nr:DUF397 domain-containing protein [Streptomyces sp. NRRL S-350]
MSSTTPRQVPKEWTKSSYSGQTGDCVRWRRSRIKPGHVEVGDSKDPDGPTLHLSLDQWRALADFAKALEV